MKIRKQVARALVGWIIPAAYAAAALTAGLTLPRFEGRLFPGLVAPISLSAATAIYSSIASGMIALTGIVFSLTFVMVQFSATAYSPRLVLWIARDRAMMHALGMFTATFLYAIAALAGVDRGGSGAVPFVSAWVSVALLMASTAMFIVLIHRISLLQINRMLVFTGDQGRKVIATIYPDQRQTAIPAVGHGLRSLPISQTVAHRGGPAAIQAVDVDALVRLARQAGGAIELASAVGDTVVVSMPLLRVRGARAPDRRARAPGRRRPRCRADVRAGPEVRDTTARGHRHQGALARHQRPDDGGAGARPDRRPASAAGEPPARSRRLPGRRRHGAPPGAVPDRGRTCSAWPSTKSRSSAPPACR